MFPYEPFPLGKVEESLIRHFFIRVKVRVKLPLRFNISNFNFPSEIFLSISAACKQLTSQSFYVSQILLSVLTPFISHT